MLVRSQLGSGSMRADGTLAERQFLKLAVLRLLPPWGTHELQSQQGGLFSFYAIFWYFRGQRHIFCVHVTLCRNALSGEWLSIKCSQK